MSGWRNGRKRGAASLPLRQVALAALGSLCFAAAAEASPRDMPAAGAHSAAPQDGSQGGALALRRTVIAGGGGTSAGGAYALSGTIAQADADPLQPSTGGVYAIAGGFWPGMLAAAPAVDVIFADGFE